MCKDIKKYWKLGNEKINDLLSLLLKKESVIKISILFMFISVIANISFVSVINIVILSVIVFGVASCSLSIIILKFKGNWWVFYAIYLIGLLFLLGYPYLYGNTRGPLPYTDYGYFNGTESLFVNYSLNNIDRKDGWARISDKICYDIKITNNAEKNYSISIDTKFKKYLEDKIEPENVLSETSEEEVNKNNYKNITICQRLTRGLYRTGFEIHTLESYNFVSETTELEVIGVEEHKEILNQRYFILAVLLGGIIVILEGLRILKDLYTD